MQIIYNYMPEFIYLLSILFMTFVNKFRETKTPKTFFTIAKLFIIAAMISMFFVNPSSDYIGTNGFIKALKFSINAIALIWLFLSCKWFLNKDIETYRYYSISMFALCIYSLMLGTQNFGVVCICLVISFVITYIIARLNVEQLLSLKVTNFYLGFSVIFTVLLAFAASTFYIKLGTLSYDAIYSYLYNCDELDINIKLSIIFVITTLLFYMSLAPFHFLFPQLVENSRLPSGGFLCLIPLGVYFGVFSLLVLNVFFPVYLLFKPVITFFAYFSIILGAISANNQKNIRKIFAYSSIFHMGVLVLGVVEFNQGNLFSSVIYLLIYLLTQLGVFSIFYGMKSKGDYLHDLEDLRGFASQRPYMGAGMLIFMISLIGAPPMLGFVGKLFIVNSLVIEQKFMSLFIIMIALVMLVDAYLKVIKVLFFEQSNKKYDRVDFGVYSCFFAIMGLVLVSIFNPTEIVSSMQSIVNEVFK